MNTDQPLSPEWVGQLADPLRPDFTLSPDANTRIKQSLLQKIGETSHPDASNLHSVRRDDGWIQMSKRLQFKILHDDGVHLSWLLKIAPGGGLPVHDHADGTEECMVLEGCVRINGEQFHAGDYQVALPGSVHHEVFSEHGSLVYLRSPSSRRKELVSC